MNGNKAQEPDQDPDRKFAEELAQLGREQEQERRKQRTGCALACGILGALAAGAWFLLARTFNTMLGENALWETILPLLALIGSAGLAIWAWIQRRQP
jgi:hypothetical protein